MMGIGLSEAVPSCFGFCCLSVRFHRTFMPLETSGPSNGLKAPDLSNQAMIRDEDGIHESVSFVLNSPMVGGAISLNSFYIPWLAEQKIPGILKGGPFHPDDSKPSLFPEFLLFS